MTEVYEELAADPQTNIDVGRLNPEERRELRQIAVDRTSDTSNLGDSGNFATVYYLAGDEQRAAEVFVEENRAQLAGVDFSKKNVVLTSVPRVVYDWILHALGERKLEKYETVVRETRSDGTHWLIDRQQYDEAPNRRYTTSESRSARVDGISLADLYDAFDDEIVESELDAHDATTGDVRYLLDYYRVADEFDCVPFTVDDEMAVRKRDA